MGAKNVRQGIILLMPDQRPVWCVLVDMPTLSMAQPP